MNHKFDVYPYVFMDIVKYEIKASVAYHASTFMEWYWYLDFRLAELTAKDKEKKLLEMAKNDLEAYIYDMNDKLTDEDHEKCSTSAQREEYSKLFAEAGEWMYEQEEDAKKEVF